MRVEVISKDWFDVLEEFDLDKNEEKSVRGEFVYWESECKKVRVKEILNEEWDMVLEFEKEGGKIIEVIEMKFDDANKTLEFYKGSDGDRNYKIGRWGKFEGKIELNGNEIAKFIAEKREDMVCEGGNEVVSRIKGLLEEMVIDGEILSFSN